MPGLKITNAAVPLLRKIFRTANAAQSLAAFHAVQQHVEHWPSGLAEGDYKDALVLRQVDAFGAAAVRKKAVKRVSVETDAPVKCRRNIACIERPGKELGGCCMKKIESRVACGSHRTYSLSQAASSCCIASI